jgi:hypothetical protein
VTGGTHCMGYGAVVGSVFGGEGSKSGLLAFSDAYFRHIARGIR